MSALFGKSSIRAVNAASSREKALVEESIFMSLRQSDNEAGRV